MTIPTFTPSSPPSSPLEVERQPRIIETEFGDGFGQVVPDGINYLMLGEFPITWVDIPLSHAQSMDNWLKTNFAAFYYTLPLESSAIKLRAKAWRISKKRGPLVDFRVTVKEIP